MLSAPTGSAGVEDVAGVTSTSVPRLPERCTTAARKLVSRLLEPDPRVRLRSLLTLQTVPFFKDFNFTNTRVMKHSPRELLETLTKRKSPLFEDEDTFHLPTFHFEEFDCDLAS